MSDFWKQVGAQATAILLAAIGAGAIAFFQSLAASNGLCPAPATDPAEIGVLGGAFKAIHTALTLRHGIMHT